MNKKLLLTLIVVFFSCLSITAQSYYEQDKEGLRRFLRQPSAQSGRSNFQEVGLTVNDTLYWKTSEAWLSKISFISYYTPAGYNQSRVYAIRWSGLNGHNIAGNLDCRYFSSMQELAISQCQVSSINLSQSNCLIYLFLENIPITSLDVRNCRELVELISYQTHLYSLDVTNNTKLKTLAVSRNNLSSLNLSYCRELVNLTANLNPLGTISLANNNKLEEVFLAGCQLTSIDLTACSKLKYLELSANNFSSLGGSLYHCVNLEALKLSYNNLTSINVSKNTKLNNFECQNNAFRFSTIPLKDFNYIFYYSPQDTINGGEILHTSLIDLSSEYSISGNITTYRWFDSTGSEVALTNQGQGKFIPGQANAGKSLTCKMYNNRFPALTLVYEVKIKGDSSTECPSCPGGCPNCPTTPECPTCPNCPNCPTTPECPGGPNCPTEPECPGGPNCPTEPECPGGPNCPTPPSEDKTAILVDHLQLVLNTTDGLYNLTPDRIFRVRAKVNENQEEVHIGLFRETAEYYFMQDVTATYVGDGYYDCKLTDMGTADRVILAPYIPKVNLPDAENINHISFVNRAQGSHIIDKLRVSLSTRRDWYDPSTETSITANMRIDLPIRDYFVLNKGDEFGVYAPKGISSSRIGLFTMSGVFYKDVTKLKKTDYYNCVLNSNTNYTPGDYIVAPYIIDNTTGFIAKIVERETGTQFVDRLPITIASGGLKSLSIQNDVTEGQLSISLYPNPVQDVLYVKGLSESAKVEVFNLLGNLVKVENIDAEGSLSLQALQSGIYIVKVTTVSGETQTVKIKKN